MARFLAEKYEMFMVLDGLAYAQEKYRTMFSRPIMTKYKAECDELLSKNEDTKKIIVDIEIKEKNA